MRRAALLVLALSISACTTEIKDLIPQDGPTMVEIYNGHLKNAGSGAPANDVLGAARRGAAERASQPKPALDSVAYTRDVSNEIDNLFPTLENPTLVMHVFPHLAGDERLPVPGYSTSFPMFERVEFALPGEVAEPVRSKGAKSKIRIIGASPEDSASSTIRSF